MRFAVVGPALAIQQYTKGRKPTMEQLYALFIFTYITLWFLFCKNYFFIRLDRLSDFVCIKQHKTPTILFEYHGFYYIKIITLKIFEAYNILDKQTDTWP